MSIYVHQVPTGGKWLFPWCVLPGSRPQLPSLPSTLRKAGHDRWLPSVWNKEAQRRILCCLRSHCKPELELLTYMTTFGKSFLLSVVLFCFFAAVST